MDSSSPSIKMVSSDARGEIYVVTLPGDRELLLLHSVAGTLRGGHSHDVDEVVTVLSGELVYHKLEKGGGEQLSMLRAGETSFNKAGEVHMGEFITDVWLTEWKIAAHKGTWSNKDYAPWREKVLAHAHS